MPQQKPRTDDEENHKGPGPEPETLKIEGRWEEAVARALRAPIPPGGVPGREKRKRGPNKVPKK
jgi:hypothetical protein